MADLESPGSAGLGRFRVGASSREVRFDPSTPGGWAEGVTTTRLRGLVRDAGTGGLVIADLASVDVTRSAGWIPSQEPLVGLWLDGADTSTQILAGNGGVTEWRDKSGAGRHATQSASALMPIPTAQSGRWINGLPVMHFASRGMRAPMFDIASSVTVFVVFATDSHVGQRQLFDIRSNSNETPLFDDGGVSGFGGRARLNSGVLYSLTPSPVVLGTPFIGRYKLHEGELGRSLSGEPESLTYQSGFVSGTNVIGIGYNGFSDNGSRFHGLIAEMIVLRTGNPSVDLINTVGLYLSDKWGAPFTEAVG